MKDFIHHLMESLIRLPQFSKLRLYITTNGVPSTSWRHFGIKTQKFGNSKSRSLFFFFFVLETRRVDLSNHIWHENRILTGKYRFVKEDEQTFLKHNENLGRTTKILTRIPI